MHSTERGTVCKRKQQFWSGPSTKKRVSRCKGHRSFARERDEVSSGGEIKDHGNVLSDNAQFAFLRPLKGRVYVSPALLTRVNTARTRTRAHEPRTSVVIPRNCVLSQFKFDLKRTRMFTSCLRRVNQ